MERLLLTGGSGFLGRNIRPGLSARYDVAMLGRSAENDVVADLAAGVPELPCRFDVVVHAAALVHVRAGRDVEGQAFFDVNYGGTKNLCKALEATGLPRSLVFISTSAVYGADAGCGITEDFPLRGETPYARSKILAEEFLLDWAARNGVVLTILRSSLMAGHDAPGNLGAMVRGIRTGAYLSIDRGRARKSLMMAEDIANLIPLVAHRGGIFNVCDNDHPSVRQLECLIAGQLDKRPPFSIPFPAAKCLARVGDYLRRWPIDSARLAKIVTSNTMSNDRARRTLGWEPMSTLRNYRI